MSVISNLCNMGMYACYNITGSYGWAIVLFTLVSKIVLLPVSLWTYYNSIKMIKIQPDVNYLKVRYYGQKDVIADEQAKLFKERKYHPLLSTIPLIIQLIILMGVVAAVRIGIQDPGIDMSFGPADLSETPHLEGIRLLWAPVVAGLSAWILCITQNADNVLQAEQSKFNKYGTMLLSVGLSLWLGYFVPVATALYWVCSNLMSVIQMYIFNWIIRPRRFVDYERLEDSRRELAALNDIGDDKGFFSENRKRERADYKRFFQVVNKHLVFYSEGSGFYKYYRGYIEYLLANTNIIIHYITSDPDDQIFELEKKNSQIRAYYIGENRLITLMMKMDADIVCMTMPDIETYHIKRSYVRKDIEYIYIMHGMGSNNLTLSRTALDHYDTLFCVGPHQIEEEQERQRIRKIQNRKLLEIGYPMLDDMRSDYERSGISHTEDMIRIMIAPSWQKDNIIDSCLEEILDQLKGRGYSITVRPHPQEVRHKKQYMESLKDKYKSDGIEIQTDFSANSTIMEADLLITDWSDICWEYAFTTYRPVLFINTPMKIMNPDYQEMSVEPLNILLRSEIGRSLELTEISSTAETVAAMLSESRCYAEKIKEISDRYIYNHGRSAEIGAKYIITQIQNRIKEKKASQQEGKTK